MQITLENLLVIWGLITLTCLIFNIAGDIYYIRKQEKIKKHYYEEAYKALNELKKSNVNG